MSGLFGSLSMASQSLQAQQYGLEVVGQNISNVNTDGYSRRVVDFVAVPTDRLDAGGGVDVQDTRAVRDSLLDHRLWQEVPAQQMQSAMADSLGVVEVALGDPGSSVDDKLTQFFDSEVAAGQLDIPDTRRAASQFYCLLKGEPHARMSFGCGGMPSAKELEHHVTATVDTFLRAYAPR